MTWMHFTGKGMNLIMAKSGPVVGRQQLAYDGWTMDSSGPDSWWFTQDGVILAYLYSDIEGIWLLDIQVSNDNWIGTYLAWNNLEDAKRGIEKAYN